LTSITKHVAKLKAGSYLETSLNKLFKKSNEKETIIDLTVYLIVYIFKLICPIPHLVEA
jgi:hypothetical protein